MVVFSHLSVDLDVSHTKHHRIPTIIAEPRLMAVPIAHHHQSCTRSRS